MAILEVTGVCDKMLSYVSDPLACGVAAVCSSWAAGLARLGKRTHNADTPRDCRLSYYLSIGAVLPRPGNGSAGLLALTVPHASPAVVCPFALDSGLYTALGAVLLDSGSALDNTCVAVHLDPASPNGVRTQRLSNFGFQLDVVGRVTDSAYCFAASVPACKDHARGQTFLQDGLSVGPFCVGLLWPSHSIVAVGLNDGKCLDDPVRGWVCGVATTPLLVAQRGTCDLARVSPNCLAVISHGLTGRPATVAVVCWTQVRGLVVSQCHHDPNDFAKTTDPLAGWQIPPLDANSTTQPVLVVM